jgi:hypothetical protein
MLACAINLLFVIPLSLQETSWPCHSIEESNPDVSSTAVDLIRHASVDLAGNLVPVPQH